MAACSVGIKNVTLELGGKSPLIIFEDADIKNAVKGALMANFLTQGEVGEKMTFCSVAPPPAQVCSNGTRVFVQQSIHDKFVAEFVKQANRMKAGDPLKDDTTVGGTITAEHAQKVTIISWLPLPPVFLRFLATLSLPCRRAPPWPAVASEWCWRASVRRAGTSVLLFSPTAGEVKVSD